MEHEPPYTAVIFSSERSADGDGYGETADAMLALAAEQPGYLGVDTVSEGRRGITVSYWRTEDDAIAWRHQAEHALARREGRQRWYASYDLHVATVHRHHRFDAD